MARAQSWLLVLLLALVVGLEHLYALQSFPGFHYDESWAANFALAISAHRVGWPLHAMSPYTFAWAHYIAAFFLHFLGVNLLFFRLSQVGMALVGIAALTRSYWKDRPAYALSFLFLLALLPGLPFNHRFAIELNGFHVACFGLFFFCYDRRMIWTALLFAWFGVTSHILFFAPALAFLGSRVMKLDLKERERNGWILWLGALLPYFAHVAHHVPETKKAWLLFGFTAALLLLLLFRGERLLKRPMPMLEKILPFLAFPFLVNALFFLPGEWTLLVNTGQAVTILPMLLGISVSLACAYLLWLERAEWNGVLLCVIFAGLMMLKPTPRYFECSMLWLVFLFAKSFLRLPALPRLALTALFLANAASAFHGYFFFEHQQRSIHFLAWKDDSREFLPKQELAKFLGLSGCPISAIKSVDSRTYEPLRFLSHGDWPLASVTCPWNTSLLIAPSSEAPQVANPKFVGGFQVWGTP